MPNVIKPKKSSVASSVPTTSSLADGEMAVNTADKKLYVRNGSSIVEVSNAIMSSADKTKLDGIAAGATAYTDAQTDVRIEIGAGIIDLMLLPEATL